MVLLRNSVILALLAASAAVAPAFAEDYTVNYMTHMDTITIGLGDATQSNIVIQHPTPWPSYINKTNIKTPAAIGTSALENMFARYASGGSGASSSGGSTTMSAGSN